MIVSTSPDVSQAAVSSLSDLRVMTYNIRHGLGNDACTPPASSCNAVPASEDGVDLERIAGVIAESGASVVCLQEVDRFWARSGNVDQPARLAEMLGMQACYGANLEYPAAGRDAGPQQYGTLILTTHRIVGWENVSLTTTEGWEPRGALVATLDPGDDRRLTVINTHLQAGPTGEQAEASAERARQLREVLDLADAADGPVIIMGDLNASPDALELASIQHATSGFDDAWAIANGETGGLTIPACPDAEPSARIDYIFVSAGLHVASATVVDTEETRLASDHFPVVADLELGTECVPSASTGR